MSVHIVTDSACDLPGDVVDALGVTVVPLTIRFGDEEFVDGVELSVEEFYAGWPPPTTCPQTAAPAPGAFEEAFRACAADGADAVVCINLSAQLSATMQSAQTAAGARAATSTSGWSTRARSPPGSARGALGRRGGRERRGRRRHRRPGRGPRRPHRSGSGPRSTPSTTSRRAAASAAPRRWSARPAVHQAHHRHLHEGVVEEAGQAPHPRARPCRGCADRLLEEPAVEKLCVVHGEAPDIDEFLELIASQYGPDDYTTWAHRPGHRRPRRPAGRRRRLPGPPSLSAALGAGPAAARGPRRRPVPSGAAVDAPPTSPTEEPPPGDARPGRAGDRAAAGPADRRPLPARAVAAPRRHGVGVGGRRRDAHPAGRREGPPPAPRGRRAVRAPLPAGGGGGGPAHPPLDRVDLRHLLRRRRRGHRHGAGPRHRRCAPSSTGRAASSRSTPSRWSAQIADALRVAHEAGIVHRDVKPGNILLSADGRVLVTDFGIAKAATASTSPAAGMTLGTAKYLAPEQVEGRPVDGRADVYALGRRALRAGLAGSPRSWPTPTLATALARLHRDPAPPRGAAARRAAEPGVDHPPGARPPARRPVPARGRAARRAAGRRALERGLAGPVDRCARGARCRSHRARRADATSALQRPADHTVAAGLPVAPPGAPAPRATPAPGVAGAAQPAPAPLGPGPDPAPRARRRGHGRRPVAPGRRSQGASGPLHPRQRWRPRHDRVGRHLRPGSARRRRGERRRGRTGDRRRRGHVVAIRVLPDPAVQRHPQGRRGAGARARRRRRRSAPSASRAGPRAGAARCTSPTHRAADVAGWGDPSRRSSPPAAVRRTSTSAAPRAATCWCSSPTSPRPRTRAARPA